MVAVGAAQQVQIVELALLAPRCLTVVLVKLPVFQALDGLAFAARLMKDSLLLIAQPLQVRQFSFQLVALFAHCTFAR